jgi:hypothetical protein
MPPHSLDHKKIVNTLQQPAADQKMMNSTVSFTTAGPSEDQWKDYQSLITQLYQSKPLKEVITVLEGDFGFKAR